MGAVKVVERGPVKLSPGNVATSSYPVDSLDDKLARLDNDSSADVIALQIELNVKLYTPLVPGTDEHVPLTNANFQDAIEACIADAYARVTDVGTVVWEASYCVLVPPGVWQLTRVLSFPGLGPGKRRTPGLRGAGSVSTVLQVMTAFAGGAAIYVGGDQEDGSEFATQWVCEGFSLLGNGGSLGNMNGIHGQCMFKPLLQDLKIHGFQNTGWGPLRGWGIFFDDPMPDALASSNAPNMQCVIKDSDISGNNGGIYFRLGQLTLRDVQMDQNVWTDIVVDNASLIMSGGSLQGTGISSNVYATRMAGGTPRIMTGWNRVLASGTGANLGVAAGDLSPVTGLSGLVEPDHAHCWLELTKPSPYGGNDKVSGYYPIDSIYNDSAAYIRKGSNHAATGSCSWKLRNCGGAFIAVNDATYHEGTVPALVWAGNALSETSVSLDNVVVANCAFAVEAYNSRVTVRDLLQLSAGAVKAHKVLSIQAPQYPRERFELDEFSRESLVCAAPSPADRYFDNPLTQMSSSAGLRFGNRLGSRRLRAMCLEADATSIIDLRSSSMVLSGSDIQSITDLVHACVAVPGNAAKYPTLNASDAVFGGVPSMNLLGAALAADTKGLVYTITGAHVPTITRQVCFLVVYRLPNTTPAAAGVRRQVGMTSNLGVPYDITVNTTDRPGVWSIGNNSVPNNKAGTVDTLAHACFFGSSGRAGISGTGDQGHLSMQAFFEISDGNGGAIWAGGANQSVALNHVPGSPTADLTVAYFASFARGLSYHERQQMLDACATEFRVANR